MTMLILAVAPALVLAIANGVRTYTNATEKLERDFMQHVIVEAQRERDVFVALRSALETIEDTPAVLNWDSPDCNATLAAFRAAIPGAEVAAVTDMTGIMRCANSPDAVGTDVSARPFFQEFVRNPQFGVIFQDEGAVSGKPVLVAYSPIRRDGELVGRLAISLRASFLAFLSRSLDASGQELRRALVSQKGEVLLTGGYPDADAAWVASPIVVQSNLSGAAQTFTAPGADGRRYVYAAAPLIDGTAWMVAGAPADGFYNSVLWSAALPIAAPLLMLLIAVGVAYFALDRLVVQHLIYLARLTRAYGRGRLELRPKATANAPMEIAMLGEDLAAMAQRLENRQDALKESAEQNRALLMEVYHRVKNNLQMVVSLLNLQSRRAASDVEREALSRVQSRIHSLSLVHEKLYASQNLSRLPVDELLRDIANHLVAGASGPQPPAIEFDLAPLRLRPDRATPVALFVNEAVTNALKHAAHPTERPRIRVRLSTGPEDAFVISIENDVADEAEETASGSLGLRLMESFARQVRGRFRRDHSGGRYVVTLDAPPDEPPPNRDGV